MRVQILSYFLVFSVALSGCGPGIDYEERPSVPMNGLQNGTTGNGSATLKTATLAATDATLSDAAKLELQTSNSEVSLKSTGTTTHADCSPGSLSANYGVSSDGNGTSRTRMSGSYTPSSTHAITSVQVRTNKVGSPTGSIHLYIHSDNGSGAPSTTLLATSAAVDASTIGNTFTTFSFSTPYTVTSGTMYHLVLKGGGSYVAAGASDKIQWWYTGAANCAAVPVGALKGSNDGTTWANLEGGDVILVKVLSSAYASDSPTATYTKDAGTVATWYPSSFSLSENPNSETGSLLYAIGASGTATPSYEYTGLTKAQLQALSGLRGRYLHLRVSFVSSGSQDASIGTILAGYLD